MKELLLGNEAVARGAWEAGVHVVSSYPGTPSTEITETLAKLSSVYCEWSPNEKVSAEVAIGAAIGGGRAMCCMKHVGLNVAADPLFTASYAGVNGGLVFAVADDPGLFSSQNDQDSRFYALSAHVPMLEPSDSAECHEFAKKAFELSEKYDTPVILRLTTRVSHSRSPVEVGERNVVPKKPYKKDIQKYVMMPGMAKKRQAIVKERDRVMTGEADAWVKLDNPGRKLGVITSGICYQYVREVFPDASVLKLGMIYPLPERSIKEFAASVEELIVVEELEPYIENYVRQLGIAYVEGKKYFTPLGELGTEKIRQSYYGTKTPVAELSEGSGLKPEDAPMRPPTMCPGCPHRGVFYTLSQLKLRVTGDIGCYTLGAAAPYKAMDACICMGASIGMSHGMEKAESVARAEAGAGDNDSDGIRGTVAVIGDSTFIHSGITGLVNIVYNKGASTVIILDNSITGMTGHQQNPTTGKTIRMEDTYPVDLTLLCKAVGVNRVRVEDPFDLKKFKAAVLEEIDANEPSVIIARRPCVLLKGVNYGKPVEIDGDKCRKCGACMRLGCPAILKTEDGRMKIDRSLCTGCEFCVQMCGFGAIGKKTEGGDNK
ncbi:MAG: indolepyruvate ferredoxin oxidoreductase subunit alpha [Clostridia bacterium]|nr:indolepyruvate ferredoxin oxidoreductase subunit alpha [Clostridia bacterium]